MKEEIWGRSLHRLWFCSGVGSLQGGTTSMQWLHAHGHFYDMKYISTTGRKWRHLWSSFKMLVSPVKDLGFERDLN